MAKHAIIKNFYKSDKWIKFRLGLINQRGNKCARCKEIIAKSMEIIGHHKIEITPENVNDHNISLNPNNVDIVCFGCHNKEHNRFGHSGEKKVYIVYGPPLSGKSSLVKENIQREDIVVDMDRLYEAVTMLPSFDKPDQLFQNIRGIHNQLIDNIKTRYGKWNNAWVVGGYSDKRKRERLANDLGAELIFCELSKENCYRRLDQDVDRQYRKDEWRGYIDKWFDTYTE